MSSIHSAPVIVGKLRLKDETGATLDSVQRKLTGAFKKITLGVSAIGAAAAAGIGVSVKAAADFEQALTR
ncbi:MAG TPA: hypothetical protein ENF89_03595, partial [Candidatus Bathyarchaeota archaeon]|nr:hypothetical protein [Candidatus Bathyarchaeota archaeon]